MADSTDIQQLIQVPTVRMDRQEQPQQTTNELLLRLLNQQEAAFGLHQDFQKNQEVFNARQDQFNITFRDEVRDIKLDVRELREGITTVKDLVIRQYDEQLKRQEDFMEGFMRKAD